MKQHTKLLLVLLTGLAIRLALYDHIVVNYDDGLYLHDAYLVTQGQIPVVDYPSRSPIFHILLSIYYFLPFDIITNYRLVQYLFAIVTTLGIYKLTQQLTDYPHVPLLAAALYFLNPFVIGYGSWVKTEILATGFVVWAVWTLTLGVASHKHHSKFIALTGILLAVGVLVRRSVLVAGFAIGLYLVVYYRHDIPRLTKTITVYSLSTIGGTFLLYTLLAKGDPTITWLLFQVHILDLVMDGGFGAFEYIRFTDLSEYLTQTYIRDWPLFRKFGPASITRIEQTMRYNPLFIIPLLAYFRGYMATDPDETKNRELDKYITAILIFLFTLLFIQHTEVVIYEFIQSGITARTTVYSHRALQGFVLVLGTIALWWLPRFPYEYATDGHRSILWYLFLLVAFSYIARNRVIYGVYWLDVLPYVTILIALGLAYWHHTLDINYSRLATQTLAVVGVVFVLVASISAPITFAFLPDQPTPTYINDIRDEVTTHSEPGDTVLTAQPMFVLQTNRHVALDLGRSYYFIREAPGSPPGDALATELENVVCESSVVVDGPAFRVLTNYNPRIRTNLERCHRVVYRVGFGGSTGDADQNHITVWTRR